MFRMLRLKPPHGWNAVAWELAIVTLGVLVALGAQQWAEQRSGHAKARHATTAIKGELGDHYANAIEWRMVHPCLLAQIERLQQRLANSRGTVDPAPVYREAAYGAYVLRLPHKEFNESAWQAAIADGVTTHLAPELRRALSDHYNQAATLAVMTDRNDRDAQRIFSLSRPLPLDPSVMFDLMQALDELRGRIDFMDLSSGQILDHVTKIGMVPTPSLVSFLVERSGTRQLCVRERLPLRSLKDASTPVDFFYSPQHMAGRPASVLTNAANAHE